MIPAVFRKTLWAQEGEHSDLILSHRLRFLEEYEPVRLLVIPEDARPLLPGRPEWYGRAFNPDYSFVCYQSVFVLTLSKHDHANVDRAAKGGMELIYPIFDQNLLTYASMRNRAGFLKWVRETFCLDR